MNDAPNVLILGIGNVLWADEGFGVRAVEHLLRHYQFQAPVKLLDGGTQGIYLVEHVQWADILVIFDAVDYGLKPGTLKCIEDDAVPNFLGAKKMSLHQTGFQEVLAMSQMLGKYPRHLLLVGVQPGELEDYGGSLTDGVRAQIRPAIDLALDYLKRFPIAAEATATEADLADPALDMRRYESERPSEAEAFRRGDYRVLASGAYALKPPLALENMTIVDVDHRGKY